MAMIKTTKMSFINMGFPQGKKRFQPGILLSLFTLVFLPVFLALGTWQLNRAQEKDQLMAVIASEPLNIDEVDWQDPPLYRSFVVSGQLLDDQVFLLDNKTLNGQFGYEVFKLLKIPAGSLAVSLGWVVGSQDRRVLPTLELPEGLTEQQFTIRAAPTNPVFGVEGNLKHPSASDVWVVQSLSSNWLADITGQKILAFAQLDNAAQFGVGPVIWQPTVMSPATHRGYALQWFAMAIALTIMFIYAGFKSPKKEQKL